LNNYKKN